MVSCWVFWFSVEFLEIIGFKNVLGLFRMEFRRFSAEFLWFCVDFSGLMLGCLKSLIPSNFSEYLVLGFDDLMLNFHGLLLIVSGLVLDSSKSLILKLPRGI